MLFCQQSLVKAMVFPVVMYGCESWTVKKAERRRIDAYELWTEVRDIVQETGIKIIPMEKKCKKAK